MFLVQVLLADVSEHVDALSFKLQEKANESRSDYQIRRWEVKRLADVIQAGDHKKYLSKNIATSVVAYIHAMRDSQGLFTFYDDAVLINPSSKEWDPTSLALYEKYDTTDVGAYIVGLVDEAKLPLEAKIKSLGALLSETKKFVGTLGQVKGAKLPKDFCGVAELQHTDLPGSEGWLVCAYQNVRRFDANCVPIQGVGSLFRSMKQTFVVYTCSIAEVLALGVSHEDFENWLESLAGQSFMKTQMLTIIVKPNCTLYIPAGHFWAYVHIEVDKYDTSEVTELDADSDLDEKERPKVELTDDSVGSAIVYPLFVQKWTDKVPMNVKTAVISMNKNVLEKKKGKSMWADRAECFYKSYGVVAESS